MANCIGALSAAVPKARAQRIDDVTSTSVRPCVQREAFLPKRFSCQHTSTTAGFFGQRVPTPKRRHTSSTELCALATEIEDEVTLEDDLRPTYEDFDRLLDKYDFKYTVGDKVVGTIVGVEPKGGWVEIGGKAAAFIPAAECSVGDFDRVSDVLEDGQMNEFMIVRGDDADGSVMVSLRRIELEVAWRRLQQYAEEDITIYGVVVDNNRGGLLVDAEYIRGFVPTSHLSLTTPAEELVGEEIPLKIIEVDQEQGRLVLSNKKAVASEMTLSYQVGDVVEGVIASVLPYGAFVDIGGINGLLHISQISHDRITDVETVFSRGEKVKAMIMSQDRERGRISLSTRKLERNHGDMLRNPQLVYDQAEEMAASFRKRVAEAEAAANLYDSDFSATDNKSG